MRTPTAFVTFVLAIAVVGTLRSHDFWLIPNVFHVAADAELVVEGRTSSTFPTSISAVTPDRIASAELVTADRTTPVSDLGVEGNSLRLRARPSTSGQTLVAVTIHPRHVPESPESFRRYLTLEGAPEALERYEREGRLPTDSITRSYAKYAKTLVAVGTDGPRVFDRVVGHPLEFVPLTDPADADADALRFRMLFLGAPLPHARGHASAAASSAADSATHAVTFETDARGEFTLAVAAPGLWNVRALHIVPAPDDAAADWDVHWATLVWWMGS
jgi:hypothetical protein